MKVTVIPVVIGAVGTITEGMIKGPEELEIRRHVETIQTTSLLRSARILRRVQESSKKLSVTQTPVKNYLLTLMGKGIIIKYINTMEY